MRKIFAVLFLLFTASSGFTAEDFLIDDFESETSHLQVPWWTGQDENNLGTKLSPVPFQREKGGAPPSSGYAAHLNGVFGENKPPYPWAQFSLSLDPEGADLSAYRALRFWAKGKGRFRVILVRKAVTDWADYEFVFELPSQWTPITASFSDFKQPSWGKPVERRFQDVKEIKFSPVDHGAPFDVWLDHIVLIADPSSQAPSAFQTSEKIQEIPLEDISEKSQAFYPISLENSANRNFQDEKEGDGRGGWTDQGDNSLHGFPTGAVTFLGIPFKISAKKNAQCVVLRGQNHSAYPTKVTLPVHRKAKALYFLHAAAWVSPRVGTYVLRFADGKTHEIPLRGGIEIFDWWNPGSSAVARVAWRGKNPVKDPTGLTLFAAANPRPDAEIAEIIAQTPGDASFLMLVGLTLAQEGPFLARLEPRRYDTSRFFEASKIDTKKRRATALDMSFLLEKPAGKHGFLKTRGEHFVFEDGTPAAFFGVNIVASANFPSKKDAEWTAELLSQIGCNLTRHHHMDAPWTNRNIFGNAPTTRRLDPESLDRLDYLVAQLQKRGIYQYFDLLVHRKITTQDGISHFEDLEAGLKIHGEFVPELIELQKEYATQLLTHQNPYTGKRYADDPAVVFIGIHNEDSLFYRTSGEGEWSLKSDFYRSLWKTFFNAWLLDRFGDRKALENRWKPKKPGRLGLQKEEDPKKRSVEPIATWRDASFEKYSEARIRDNFYFDFTLQRTYYQQMKEHLRSLGYQGLICGSNHWVDVPADLYLNAQLDFIDRHAYFAHPSGGWGYKPQVTFEPSAMVRNSRLGLLGDLAARRVKGKPFVVSEWQTSAPNDYRVEGLPLMAAYCRLQGWSAVQFAFSHQDHFPDVLSNNFDIHNQPAQLAAWPLAALLFHRGDVRETPEGFFDELSDAEVLQPSSRAQIPPALIALFKTGVAFTGKKPSEKTPPKAWEARFSRDPLVSETGELSWDRKKGLFRVVTTRTQGFVGFTDAKKEVFPAFEVEIENPFALFFVSALDGEKPLSEAKRWLCFAAANAVNFGQEVHADGNRLTNPGDAPILAEALVGRLSLKIPPKVKQATVYPLSLSGVRGKPLKTERKGNTLFVPLEVQNRALHYEVVFSGEK